MTKTNFRPRIFSVEGIFLTFFGAGLSKYAPGTVGTLASIPLYYFLGSLGVPPFFLIPILTIATVGACIITEITQKKYELHDPSWIVIDEVLGMGVTWLFMQKHHFIHYILLFALFRLFDIFKIWPATYFDKKVKHGAGTIIDDIVSGLFAGTTYLVIEKLGLLP